MCSNQPHPKVHDMSAYGMAHLENVDMGPQIVEYLERIDGTLRPFSGKFIVHGGRQDVVEGTSKGAFIVIEFPDREHLEGWYASDAYREILPLRAEHSDGLVIMADGVDADHKATDILG